MRTAEAIVRLADWDRRNRYVYLKRDLGKVFNEAGNTLNQTLKRLKGKGVLVRAAHGVYVYALSSRVGAATIQEIALTLRRGEYVFESLESALSQWGVISQVPIDRITVMTTGSKGVSRTPYGTIEFVHTKLTPDQIRQGTLERPGQPLPIATEAFALRNLRRTGRSAELLAERGSHE
ncbi:MAG: DUF6088 family protein [Propionibacteriaceae bacterium]|jgi:predicted transcriptional regulator of viral defense system|nr:DUF6088 family protein [Propionibacteriaceae bacterium]